MASITLPDCSYSATARLLLFNRKPTFLCHDNRIAFVPRYASPLSIRTASRSRNFTGFPSTSSPNTKAFFPCSPKGSTELLHKHGPRNVIGRSNIVWMTSALSLQTEDATVACAFGKSNAASWSWMKDVRLRADNSKNATSPQKYVVAKPIWRIGSSKSISTGMLKNALKKKIAPRKKVRKIPKGVIHVQASFNNTIVTVTDVRVQVICWSSAGCKFKNARRGTPFAAQTAAEDALQEAMKLGMQHAEVMIKGAGLGRDAALRAIRRSGISISFIRDVTPLPHNGCRPPKQRRV